jgi:hypothetical protein
LGLAGVVIFIVALWARAGSEILTVPLSAAVLLLVWRVLTLVWRIRRPCYGRIAEGYIC